MPDNQQNPSLSGLFDCSPCLDGPSEPVLSLKSRPEIPIEMVAKGRTDTVGADFGPELRKSAVTTSESLILERMKSANTIYLFRRGAFVRAYDRSAWLH